MSAISTHNPLFTIADTSITIFDGLYSLGDLHKASGSENKHRPTFFLQNQETKELISEIQSENKIVVKVIKGNFSNGLKQGTYVCKELVYRYAMWISAKFSLMVIRAFDSMVSRSDSQQREILVKACSKLAIGNMLISDVYLMVGKQFGYEGGIKDIPTPLLPEATAFVYEMILRLKQPNETNNLAIMDCGKKLIHHMNYIYSWYQAIEQPFKMLSPKLNAEIHDHMQDGKIFATSLARHLNIDEPMPKKYWSISR